MHRETPPIERGRKHNPRARFCSALRVRQTRNPSDTFCVRRTSNSPGRSVARTQNLRHADYFANSAILSKIVSALGAIPLGVHCRMTFAIAYFHKTKKVTRSKLHPRWCTPSCDLFCFMKISDCECNAAATSHGMAPKAALVIQNHEFAENTCMPLFMISVRSSLDSG